MICFSVEQVALALSAPPIAAQRHRSHDPMARDRRQSAGGAAPATARAAFGVPIVPQFRIARVTRRNPQCRPRVLERCPPDVEGGQPDPRRFDLRLGDELLEIGVTAEQLRRRNRCRKDKGVRFVAERYGADTVIARGNQDRTQ